MSFSTFLASLFTPKKNKAPWENGISIYEHIINNLDTDGGLLPDALNLPDEPPSAPDQINWAPGALDGVMSHHASIESGDEQLEFEIATAFQKVGLNTGLADQIVLYNLLLKADILRSIEGVTRQIVALKVPIEPTHTYLKIIATQAPDRKPIKFAIALLGLINDPADLDLIVTLGKHDEFTLYAAVAIQNLAKPNAEQVLWQLAKQVHGWGRIHIVERLGMTENAEIKNWLITQGFENSVMNEYLAYICAVAGELNVAISAPAVSADVLNGAAAIIQALISGGPTTGIDGYEQSAVVITNYLRHLANDTPDDLLHLITLFKIKDFLTDEHTDWEYLEECGWNEVVKISILASVNRLIALPKWHTIIITTKELTDPVKKWHLQQARALLGIA